MNFHVKYFDKLRPTLTNMETLSLRVTRTVALVVQCGVPGIYSRLGLSHWMNSVFWIVGLGLPWGKIECLDDMHGTTSVWTSRLLFLSGSFSSSLERVFESWWSVFKLKMDVVWASRLWRLIAPFRCTYQKYSWS